MGKQVLLSSVLSQMRTLLLGGGSTNEVLARLRGWGISVPVRGVLRPSPRCLRWCDQLCVALRTAIPLGAPVAEVLRELYPLVIREERRWMKLKVIERQFGFQGALALVVPWAVAAVVGTVPLNYWGLGGAVFQSIGLAAFCLLVRKATDEKVDESSWLFDFMMNVWMQIEAGVHLHKAVQTSVQADPSSPFARQWMQWMASVETNGSLAKGFVWPERFELSAEVSNVLTHLLQTGAPGSDFLSTSIAQLEDEKQASQEEQLALVPTKISLVFCGFFTPAVFLIFIGALWPELSTLSI
ncbi:MAG: type II secretion system F family protein [Bdellovibrionota bacterium]